MWDTRLASQPEIQSYWKRLTEKYHLRSHLVFNSLVTSAEWSVTEQIYSIQIRDVHTGVTTSTKAQVLISATGALSAPRSPNLPGISTFKGKSFHSAGWNHGINLCGKRVAVIGNGASA
jgi:cation diffusion facilitator CzcD-associated flavoprotein CzcO